MPPSRRKPSNTAASVEHLTKEQRIHAIAQARVLLDDVRSGWEYVPAAPPAEPVRRDGSLGAWRPSGGSGGAVEATDEDDDSDMDDEEYEVGGSSSYRRATTPPTTTRRRKHRGGVWRRREDDSDVDLGQECVWEGPDDVPTPEKIRERQKRALEADMEWNEGLRLWVRRRDAWTGANEDGEVRVGESRFKDNPLYALIGPATYEQIYTKVCMGGSQPPIPINLRHLNNALVEGWKKDDQWPPKPSRPEPSIRVKRKGNDPATAAAPNAAMATVAAGPGRKGRDAVKKVLGF